MLGAARIAPAALIRPAAANPEATVEVVAARDPGRAAAYAGRHRIPQVGRQLPGGGRGPGHRRRLHPPPQQPPRPVDTGRAGGRKARAVREALHLQRRRGGGRGRRGRQGGSRSGLVVLEAFHYRYHPLARRMREIVDSGELGRLRHIETWLCAPIVNKSDIRYQFDLAGGAMMDMGCYVVNMARMLGGEEPSVISATAKLHDPGRRPGHVRRTAVPERPHRLGALLDVVLVPPPPGRPGGRRRRRAAGVQSDRAAVSSVGSPCAPAVPGVRRSPPAGPPTPTSWTRSAMPSSEASRPSPHRRTRWPT